MDDKRQMLRHFLAAIAYRTQKAIRGAPPEFAFFRAGNNVRTPLELIRHLDGLMGYARTFFIGGQYRPPESADFQVAVIHFHDTLQDLARHLTSDTDFHGITPEQMLQGPLSDAMTHAGQIAMLRRLYGDPVASENFIYAQIDPHNMGPEQPSPARPDEDWTPDV